MTTFKGYTSFGPKKGIGRLWEKLTGSHLAAIRARREKTHARSERGLRFMNGPNFKPTRRQQASIDSAVASRAEHEDPELKRLTLDAAARVKRIGKFNAGADRRSDRYLRAVEQEEKAVGRTRAAAGLAASGTALLGTTVGLKKLRDNKRRELRKAASYGVDPITMFTAALLEG